MRISKIIPIILLILSLINELVLPSDTTSVFSAGFRGHYGFIIPHSAAIEQVSHTNPFGFEISFSRFHRSYNKWQIFNAYWISGIQSGAFDFQNPDILGMAYYVTVFAEPVIFYNKSNRIILSVRGGIGLSFHNKFYDRIENPLNQFFSTGINFPLFVDLKLRHRIGQQNYLTLSGCYNHISNGGFKQPNKGMNFPTLAIGFERFSKRIDELNHSYSSSLRVERPGLTMMFQVLTAMKIVEATDEMPEKAVFAFGLHSRLSKQ
ncbi:MAG: acyloxyacyl hydrolase, partial [Bacteroidales bacterium]|nr:acyloxyacyl hydrolase [Bacteroidales bacterium]